MPVAAWAKAELWRLVSVGLNWPCRLQMAPEAKLPAAQAGMLELPLAAATNVS